MVVAAFFETDISGWWRQNSLLLFGDLGGVVAGFFSLLRFYFWCGVVLVVVVVAVLVLVLYWLFDAVDVVLNIDFCIATSVPFGSAIQRIHSLASQRMPTEEEEEVGENYEAIE